MRLGSGVGAGETDGLGARQAPLIGPTLSSLLGPASEVLNPSRMSASSCPRMSDYSSSITTPLIA